MQAIKNLTEGPISRQLFDLALPIMGTSFIQMAYSLTDMAWVGRLGSEAVAAIGAVGILTWMTQSISLMNKVGAEVTVGHSIGAQNAEEAKMFASHNLTIGLLVSLVWGALLFVFAHPVISLYKLEPEITDMAVEYLRIVATGFPFVFLASAFTGIHNAAGLSKIPFYVSGSGLLLNMILDPLFILGFGWGTAGAAYATWLSECAVVLLFVYQLKVRNKLWPGFRFFVRLKSTYSLKIVRIRSSGCFIEWFLCHYQFVDGTNGFDVWWTYRIDGLDGRWTDRGDCLEYITGIQYGIKCLYSSELCGPSAGTY